MDVPNRDGKLIPGMYAEVSLKLAESANALAVPLQALRSKEAKSVAAVVTPRPAISNSIRCHRSWVRKLDRGSVRLERRRHGNRRRSGPLVPGTKVKTKLTDLGGRVLNVPICHPHAVLHHRGLPGHRRSGRQQRRCDMPVDMFPAMNIPVVVVATFYSGMPPEQIETDITSRFERFFTLGSGIEHIESRSLPGVSVIKVYFQPGSQRRLGRDLHQQPGDGELAPAAAGNTSAPWC